MIKHRNFVLVSQISSEINTDYIIRVELLSRDAGFEDEDALRRHYSLVLDVNRLRDTNL